MVGLLCLPPVRVVWFHPTRCPLPSETDAIQILTNRILNTADALASHIAAAGYKTLLVDACSSLSDPLHRVPLQQYAAARGLSLIFSEPLPRSLDPRDIDVLVTHGSDRASERSATCLVHALSRTSGVGGWNDPRSSISLTRDAGVLPRLPLWNDPATLRQLRVRIAAQCIHSRPIVLSHGFKAAGALANSATHEQLAKLVSDRFALAVHAADFNASSPHLACRHAVRIPSNAEGVQAWTRVFCTPAATRGAVGALLLVNTLPHAAEARLPWDATWPLSSRNLFAVQAWSTPAAAGASAGIAPGAQLSSVMRSLPVPANDVVLLMLFSSSDRAAAAILRDAAASPEAASDSTGGASWQLSQAAASAPSPLLIAAAAAVAAVVAVLARRRYCRGRDARSERNGLRDSPDLRFLDEGPRTPRSRANSREVCGSGEGTESKRKGRGRSSRPRLPTAWGPPKDDAFPDDAARDLSRTFAPAHDHRPSHAGESRGGGWSRGPEPRRLGGSGSDDSFDDASWALDPAPGKGNRRGFHHSTSSQHLAMSREQQQQRQQRRQQHQ